MILVFVPHLGRLDALEVIVVQLLYLGRGVHVGELGVGV